MSRIGKLPVKLPKGVTATLNSENEITIKGPLGELKQKIAKNIEVKIEDSKVFFLRSSELKADKAMHGLYRALVNNMVQGVSSGYEKKMELVGVGYKAEAKGQILQLSLGYSHDIYFQLPDEVKVETVTEKRSNPIITLRSHDKQLIGQIAAKIRSFRMPEPYKGKGIRFIGEYIRKKAGKTATAAASSK